MKSKMVLAFLGMLSMQINLHAQNTKSNDNDIKLPLYECHKIETRISLTGRVDDPLWKEARVIKLSNTVTGQPGRFNTTVRMLNNNKYLYIAFQCDDNYIWGTIAGRDSNIFEEECVEVFICPSGKIRQYYEIDVSPLNAVFDAFILNGKPLTGGWNGFRSWKDYTCDGMETKVYINGESGIQGAKGWSVEYAIPFSSITGSDNLSPVSGEEWRINLYRIDSPEKGKQEFYAWSPTGAIDFHRGWKFGILKFVGN